MAAKPREQAPKSQVERFKETAREVETDDREETFDRALKRIAKAAPEKKAASGKA